ncbi:carboxypeptidase M32 [Leptospira langatensis]|uniref:Metal-dependent carboxypeptidase n=1 Tax=Leptospira langatensis TaxID=2484983 RepID=A0A5F1ZVW7_9LEPT|nr:carboxypeptidase M32 [Leptospira langatensis]TGK03035.1 carboxypeptidase M32 [Leptospira langatensis]TGL41791.1 carboxypeptidase M32 [Leptospira langatensis]
MWESELANWEKELPAFRAYRDEFRTIYHLRNITGILHWDMEVTIPQEAQEERGDQLSLLSGLAHKSFVSDSFRALAEKAKEENSRLDLPGKELRTRELDLLFKDLDRSSCLPISWVEEFSKITSQAHSIWADARKKNDSASFLPVLEKIIDLSFQKTEFFGFQTEAYDALLDEYEPGAKASDLETLFSDLRKSLVPLLAKAKDAEFPFAGEFSIEKQAPFNQELPVLLGLSKEGFRLDASAHPFSTSLGSADKRITTRYETSDPLSSVYSVLHETGHALYESGISLIPGNPSPLKDSVSLGVHESQSRLWENQVGRSKEFWEGMYPLFLQKLGLSESSLPFAKLYSFVNKSKPSLIRVEADQITYNLHIILRFQIERAIFKKEISVKQISSAWKEGMKDLLGIDVPDDSKGYLQDVHWSGGAFGYFPTYSLGNIYAAQLYSAFLKQNPQFSDELKKRETSSLLGWLRKNVHSKGRSLEAKDLIRKATGEEPNAKYLVEYLGSKIAEQG